MLYIHFQKLISQSQDLARRVKCVVINRWYENIHALRATLNPTIGVTKNKRQQELIVSLTTIPERIGKVHLCIESLLRQSVKPDRLILWLSETSEPGRPQVNKDALPFKLIRLQRRGLEIRWCKDIRSFRKIIPALRLFPKALVVTSDDDVFYPKTWLENLYQAYLQEPEFIHCHRAHLVNYGPTGIALPYVQWNICAPGIVGPSQDIFPTGVGGVLYAPGHLHPDVLNEDVFLNLCPTADDVWLKTMSLIMNVKCKKVKPEIICYVEIRIANNRVLSHHNVNSNGNDLQISRVSQRYNVFTKKKALFESDVASV